MQAFFVFLLKSILIKISMEYIYVGENSIYLRNGFPAVVYMDDIRKHFSTHNVRKIQQIPIRVRHVGSASRKKNFGRQRTF